MKNAIRFTAILFAVITLSALMAHLLELRVKINLSKEDYQIVQGIYSGWQWLGIFEIGAIILLMRELVCKECHFFFTKEGSNEFRIGSQLSHLVYHRFSQLL